MDSTQRCPFPDDEIDCALALLDRLDEGGSPHSRRADLRADAVAAGLTSPGCQRRKVALGVAVAAALSILATLYIALHVEAPPRPVILESGTHASGASERDTRHVTLDSR